MSGVYYCSSTNSTFFTKCCNVAICDDQQKCPRCKTDVTPFYGGMSESDRELAHGGYYHHNTRMARMRVAQKERP
jgi:hypothetical protein